jgi:hypothetical protein
LQATSGREIRLVIGGFETQAKDDDRRIRVRSLNEAIEAHKHPERFPVIASGDALQAGTSKSASAADRAQKNRPVQR